MFNRIIKRWNCRAGYREVLAIAIPLILSCSAHSLQMFIDRMFLARYDLDMMPAAMQAGVTSFTFLSLFMGVIIYVSTFVSQYYGAKRYNRIGPAVWQGVYLAIVFGVMLLTLFFASESIFGFLNHAPNIRNYENQYYKIMCLGAPFSLVGVAFSCFYTGRGKTWTVLFVNGFGSALNIMLDYVLIFGKFGFPEMGIRGAALGTVLSMVFSMIFFAVLFFQPKYEKEFSCLSGYRPNFELMKRLIRFGFPAGLQFFLDMMSFTLFIGIVGRLGKIAQTATTMTFSINILAFLPMIGMGQAVSILVGKSIGAERPRLSERAAYSAFHLCFVYMVTVAILFTLMPEFFLSAFKPAENFDNYQKVRDVASNLLFFLAIFCLFDTGNIIFSSALKGAGDTRFVMFMSVGLHWLMLVLPPYLIVVKYQLKNGLYWCWFIIALFVAVLAGCYYLRFIGGKWKKMKVIEKVPAASLPQVTDAPTTEMDY